MVNYVKLAATAQRLIEANGRDVTLYKKELTPAAAAKPWRGVPASTAPESTMGPIKIAFVPVGGSGLGYLLQDENGQVSKEITQEGLMAADSITALSPPPTELDPKLYSTVVDGSRAFRIVKIGELKPGDTSLIFVVGLAG